MKKQYVMIDILKFVSAILIVAIHTQPFKDYTDSVFFPLYTFLKCFAIPFFFVSSSFLFFKRIDLSDFGEIENLRHLVGWAARLLKIYFIYTSINLLIEIVIGNSYREIHYLKFFLMGTGNGYLWFLATLIVSVLIIFFLIYIFSHVVRTKHALVIVVSVLTIGTGIVMIILQFYHGYFTTTMLKSFIELYYKKFDNVRNILSGVFYCCIGLIVVICEKYYRPIINKIFGIISVIVAYVEFMSVSSNSLWYEEYSTGLLVIFIFFLMLECTQYNNKVIFSKYLRKASNVYYLQQRYIIIVITLIKKYVHISIFDSNINIFLTVIFVLSLFTLVYLELEKTNLQKVLKYMY